eukprot:gene1991-3037_t
MTQMNPDASTFASRPELKRSNSAPVLLTASEEWSVCEEEAFRLSSEYARWFYSHSPRSSKMVPKPLITCDTIFEIVRVREELGILPSSFTLPHKRFQKQNRGSIPALVDDKESVTSSIGGRNSPEQLESVAPPFPPSNRPAGAPPLTRANSAMSSYYGTGLNSRAAPFNPNLPGSMYHPSPTMVPQHSGAHPASSNGHPANPGTPDFQSALYSTPMQSPVSPISFGYPSPSTPCSQSGTQYFEDGGNHPNEAHVISVNAMNPNLPHSQLTHTPPPPPPGVQAPINIHTHGLPNSGMNMVTLPALTNTTNMPYISVNVGGQPFNRQNPMFPQPTVGQNPPNEQRKRPSRARSKLMEDYRATAQTVSWELRQLVGHVVEFTTDQEGSRLIQRKLEKDCTQEDLYIVFREVLPVALVLMQDVFGNYVVQKLLEHGSSEMRRELVNCLRGNTLNLALQTYGCRIVQKALEVMTDEERLEIVHELDGNVPKCVQDQNGNHVIQKCIEVMSERVAFIVESFVGRVAEFATHAYGCRCVQRILEYCKNHKEIIPILDEVLQSVRNLVTDQYGNYVVQHVITNSHPQYQYAIIQKLKGCFSALSTHKFASNVVEKMFEYASPSVRTSLLEELTLLKDDGVSGLVGAVIDQYGNYVMQKIFDLCDDDQKTLVAEHLKPNVAYLRRAPFGKHFVMRLEKQGCLPPAAPTTPTTPVACGPGTPTKHLPPSSVFGSPPQITHLGPVLHRTGSWTQRQ